MPIAVVNGITLGGVRGLEWSRNIEISNCHFHGNIDTQMIDLELHGDAMATPAQFNRNLYIHDCVFESQSPHDTTDMDQFAIVLYAVMDFRVERCDIRGPVIVRNGHGELRNNTGGITQFTLDRFSSGRCPELPLRPDTAVARCQPQRVRNPRGAA